MDQDRKYFGMTVPQLGILGGLAGALCLILCVAGWLIFGGGLGASNVPQAASTANPTATLIVIPTDTSTPAPTAIPYEQLIPSGWKQHRTALIEIWFPTAYKPTNFLDDIFLESIPELKLSQPAVKTSLYDKYAVVAYEPLTTESLESFLDLKLQSEDSSIRVVERRNVLLNSMPAVRIVIEGRANNLELNELAYVIQDGNTVWYVMYVAQINEFYAELETFEKSMLTFRLVK